jgi:hypothetical protein
MEQRGPDDSREFLQVRCDHAWGRLLRARWRALVLCALALLLALPSVGSTQAAAAPGWQGAGTLPVEFNNPSAVLLADGRVLAATDKAAALYTMSTNSWTATGAITVDARGGRLIALADGGALLVGGTANSLLPDPFAPTRQVLRFNPTTNTWTKAADMHFGRHYPELVTMNDGQILAIGGDASAVAPGPPYRAIKEVERYDPRPTPGQLSRPSSGPAWSIRRPG